MTGRKALGLGLLSAYCLIFGPIACFGYTGDEYVYLPQGATFSCARAAHSTIMGSMYDPDFVHREELTERDKWQKEVGLDFDPTSCAPFYMRPEVQD